MRRLSTLVTLLTILAIVGNIWRLSQQQTAAPAASTCQIPIRWRLATLDEKFNLSSPQALESIRAAAQAWNQQLGVNVFIEDAENGFPINFIYDERQQQLLAGQRLVRNVDRYDEYLQQLSADLTQLSSDHQQQLAAFERQKQQFSEQLARRTLDAQSAQQQQAELQIQADGLNALAQKINDKNKHLQQSVQDRNQLLQDAAPPSVKIAEVGLLIRTGTMLEMRIFAYRDAPTLQQTITHEFGHALGIDHLPQTEAIMHEMLSGEQQQLTAADVSAAQQLCQQHWR